MEIILENKYNETKKIELEEGKITTIQSNNVDNIIKKMKKKNDIVIIDYDENYYDEQTLLDDIKKYGKSREDLDELLSVFDLKSKILDKDIDNISFTEKIFLKIIKGIMLSKKYIVFLDIYKYLDYNNQKKVKEILLYLKNNNYYIVISSSDVNVLYKLGDYSVVWYKDIFEYGKTDDIYSNVEIFVKNRLFVPTLPYITYKAKKEKNVKLFYSKDVRDIIKDIYKHV